MSRENSVLLLLFVLTLMPWYVCPHCLHITLIKCDSSRFMIAGTMKSYWRTHRDLSDKQLSNYHCSVVKIHWGSLTSWRCCPSDGVGGAFCTKQGCVCQCFGVLLLDVATWTCCTNTSAELITYQAVCSHSDTCWTLHNQNIEESIKEWKKKLAGFFWDIFVCSYF